MTDNPFTQDKLDSIFFINPRYPKYIGSKESTTLEFKETFSFGSLSEYAKVMASFANNKGGYIVFGIADSPRQYTGIDGEKFDNVDIAKLTTSLNDIFSPIIEWDLTTYNWNNSDFGLIYVYENNEKPVISNKNAGDIKEAEIYYRYRGKSEKIKPAELRFIIQSRIDKEKAAWREVIEKTAIMGPGNVALMDTLHGKIEGLGNTVLIDEDLLPKLKFIKQGEFQEKKGEPTLKLVGDLKTVPVNALKEKRVEVVVGEDIYKYRPSDVSNKVEETLGEKFKVNSEHLKAWKKHGVRPNGNEIDPPFKNQYCEYKPAERQFRYSDAWIEFLINTYSDENNYQELVDSKINF